MWSKVEIAFVELQRSVIYHIPFMIMYQVKLNMIGHDAYVYLFLDEEESASLISYCSVYDFGYPHSYSKASDGTVQEIENEMGIISERWWEHFNEQ